MTVTLQMRFPRAFDTLEILAQVPEYGPRPVEDRAHLALEGLALAWRMQADPSFAGVLCDRVRKALSGVAR